MPSVAIIDYGMGNLRSVSKAVEHVNSQIAVNVTSDPAVILGSDRVIFPGVGALSGCMAELTSRGLTEVIKECARSKPFFGVCLGMQALLDHSDENGGVEGLNVFQGNVLHLAEGRNIGEKSQNLKIPHMGWNKVCQTRWHPLWKGIEENSRFYFVHSYFVAPENTSDVVGVANYGDDFTVCIARENIFAAQFHPEKSQHAGLTLLDNFLNWDGQGE